MEVGEPLTEMCLDRNDFDESVWSYGLYDSTTGMRINRDSGFSIMKTQGDKDYYGWIGYWGVWFPESVTVNDNDTVYKVTYGPGGGEPVPYHCCKEGREAEEIYPETTDPFGHQERSTRLYPGPRSPEYHVSSEVGWVEFYNARKI